MKLNRSKELESNHKSDGNGFRHCKYRSVNLKCGQGDSWRLGTPDCLRLIARILSRRAKLCSEALMHWNRWVVAPGNCCQQNLSANSTTEMDMLHSRIKRSGEHIMRTAKAQFTVMLPCKMQVFRLQTNSRNTRPVVACRQKQ